MRQITIAIALLALCACEPALLIQPGADDKGGLLTSAPVYGPETRQQLADKHCAQYGKTAHFIGSTDPNTRMFRCQ